eukprot:262621-Chlamydomonas_euryale.AAC.7
MHWRAVHAWRRGLRHRCQHPPQGRPPGAVDQDGDERGGAGAWTEFLGGTGRERIRENGESMRDGAGGGRESAGRRETYVGQRWTDPGVRDKFLLTPAPQREGEAGGESESARGKCSNCRRRMGNGSLVGQRVRERGRERGGSAARQLPALIGRCL